MEKNKNLIALIVFGVFVIAAVLFLQAPASSGNKMMANVVISELQAKINILFQQINELKVKIQNMKREDQDIEKGKTSPVSQPMPVRDARDIKPPVLSNLEPEDITFTSAVITWGTDELSDSAVIYADEYIQKGVENKSKRIATDSAFVTHHRVKLTGLKPNTKYYYYVSSTDVNGNNSLSNTHSVTTISQ